MPGNSSWEVVYEAGVRLPVGALMLIIVIGTPLYLLFNFGAMTVTGVLLALSVAFLSNFRSWRNASRHRAVALAKADEHPSIHSLLLSLLNVALCGISLYLLATHATHQSILGPWAATPPIFFGILFLQLITLATVILRGLPSLFALPLISLNGAVILGIIPLLFPLGFGFDPAIHEQATKTILENGLISPKTPYYTGQYVLIAFLAKLFSFPVETLGRLLLPLLAIVSIPTLGTRAFQALGSEKRFALIASFGILLALTPVIESPTPWGFSVLCITLLTIESIPFFCDNGKDRHPFFCILLALAAALIHPIAGIPALAFVIICGLIAYVPRSKKYLSRILLCVVVLLGGCAVPLAFMVYAQLNHLVLPLALHLPTIPLPLLALPWRFDALLDPLYALAIVTPLLGILFWLFGIGHALRSDSPPLKKAAIANISIGAVCLISYVILRYFFSFDFLIGYEQLDYTNRFLVLLTLFTFPWTLAPGARILAHIFSANTRSLVRITALCAVAAIATGVVYLAYPRNDAYTSFHGYNLSAADLDAVRWIQNDAHGEPYVVLSNQVTAGAAIKEYGFAQYFDFTSETGTQHVFYYPVPTSSPLYQFFLAMMQNPDRAIAEDAMRRSGVKRAYLVIHRYEPRAPNIVKSAQQSADHCESFDNTTVTACLYSYQGELK